MIDGKNAAIFEICDVEVGKRYCFNISFSEDVNVEIDVCSNDKLNSLQNVVPRLLFENGEEYEFEFVSSKNGKLCIVGRDRGIEDKISNLELEEQ